MTLTARKVFLHLAFLAASWLAVGNSIQVWVAAAQHQTIDLTVCTSMGVMKVAQPADGTDSSGDSNALLKEGSAKTVMKHCGNTALAVGFVLPVHPVELSFATPNTVASWRFVQIKSTQTERSWENAPPPLRGPPDNFG